MKLPKLAFASLAILLVCAGGAAALTGQEAIKIAVDDEAKIPELQDGMAALKEAVVEPEKTQETIDGVAYKVLLYLDPVLACKFLKEYYPEENNLFKTIYLDPAFETGRAVALITEYSEAEDADAGDPISDQILTMDHNCTVLTSTTIEYHMDGSMTCTVVDYRQFEDNKGTMEIAPGGNIRDFDPNLVIIETEETIPKSLFDCCDPDVVTCPNTGMTEIRLPA